MTALVPGWRMVSVRATGSPAFTAAGTVVSSRGDSRVSNGSPGTSAMPHLRQRLPASPAVTSGCIGQNHAVVPGGAELCCAAAPSVSSTTRSSASLFRGIVIQGEGRWRITVGDGLHDRSRCQRHRFLEHVRCWPQLVRVLHPEQHRSEEHTSELQSPYVISY